MASHSHGPAGAWRLTAPLAPAVDTTHPRTRWVLLSSGLLFSLLTHQLVFKLSSPNTASTRGGGSPHTSAASPTGPRRGLSVSNGSASPQAAAGDHAEGTVERGRGQVAPGRARVGVSHEHPRLGCQAAVATQGSEGSVDRTQVP